MADDMFDDFEEFDDMDFDTDGLGDEPAEGREASDSIVGSAISGFTDEFTDDKIDTISNMSTSLGKKLTGASGSELEKGLDIGMTELSKTAEELRVASRPFLKSIAAKVPKGGLLENIHDKLLGLSDDLEKSRNREDSEDDKIAAELNHLLGEKESAELKEKRVQEAFTSTMAKSSLDSSNKIAGFAKLSYDFQNTITNSYYRKSLELKYKLYYSAEKSFALASKTDETMLKQLEGIVRNTALPEYVKMRNTEVLKEQLKASSAEGFRKSLFGESSLGERLGANLKKRIGTVGNTLKESMAMTNDQLEQSAELEEMGIKTDHLAMGGGIAGNTFKDVITDKLSSKIRKSKFGGKYVENMISMLDDPESALADAGKAGEVGKGGNKAIAGIAKMFKPLFRDTNNRNIQTVEKENLDSSTFFDIRTKQSINMVIPSYLAKIEAGIRSLRTNKEEDVLSFDRDKQSLVSLSDVSGKLQDELKKDNAMGGVATNVDNLVKTILDNTDKALTNGQINEVKDRLYDFAISGKSLSSLNLVKNGFYDNLSPKVSEAFKEGLDNYLRPEDEQGNKTLDVDNKDKFDSTFKKVKTGISDPTKIVNEFINNGNVDELIKQGIVKYNPRTKNYDIDLEKYHKLQKGINRNQSNIDQSEKIRKANAPEVDEALLKTINETKQNAKDKISETTASSKKFIKDKIKEHVGTDEEILSFLDEHINYTDNKEALKSTKEEIFKYVKGKSSKDAKTIIKEVGADLKDFSDSSIDKLEDTKYGKHMVEESRKVKKATSRKARYIKAKTLKLKRTKQKELAKLYKHVKDPVARKEMIEKIKGLSVSDLEEAVHNAKQGIYDKAIDLSKTDLSGTKKSFEDGVNSTKQSIKDVYKGNVDKTEDGSFRETLSEDITNGRKTTKSKLSRLQSIIKNKLRGSKVASVLNLDNDFIDLDNLKPQDSFENMKMNKSFTLDKEPVEEQVKKVFEGTTFKETVKAVFDNAKDIFKEEEKPPEEEKNGFETYDSFSERKEQEKEHLEEREEKEDEVNETTVSLLTKIKEALTPKEKKKERKNSWTNILKRNKDSEEDDVNVVKKETKKSKDKKSSGILGLLGGLAGAAVIGSFKTAFKLITSVPTIIKSLFSVVSGLSTGLRLAVSGVRLFGKGLLGLGKFLAKIATGNIKEAFGFGDNDKVDKKSKDKKSKKPKTKPKSKGMFKNLLGKVGKIGKVGLSIAKRFPGLGLLIGAGFAAKDLLAGDFAGAGVELASGLVSSIPIVGTMASVMMDMNKENITDIVKSNDELETKITENTNESIDSVKKSSELQNSALLDKLDNNIGNKLTNDITNKESRIKVTASELTDLMHQRTQAIKDKDDSLVSELDEKIKLKRKDLISQSKSLTSAKKERTKLNETKSSIEKDTFAKSSKSDIVTSGVIKEYSGKSRLSGYNEVLSKSLTNFVNLDYITTSHVNGFKFGPYSLGVKDIGPFIKLYLSSKPSHDIKTLRAITILSKTKDVSLFSSYLTTSLIESNSKYAQDELYLTKYSKTNKQIPKSIVDNAVRLHLIDHTLLSDSFTVNDILNGSKTISINNVIKIRKKLYMKLPNAYELHNRISNLQKGFDKYLGKAKSLDTTYSPEISGADYVDVEKSTTSPMGSFGSIKDIINTMAKAMGLDSPDSNKGSDSFVPSSGVGPRVSNQKPIDYSNVTGDDGLGPTLPETFMTPLIYDGRTELRYKSLGLEAKKFYIGFSRHMATKGVKLMIPGYGGNRSLSDQAYLYAQGRTRKGNKVTWTATKSRHIGGAAIDIISLKGYSDPKENMLIATEMREFARLNPEYGASFLKLSKDPNHIQFDNAKKIQSFSAEELIRKGQFRKNIKRIDTELTKPNEVTKVMKTEAKTKAPKESNEVADSITEKSLGKTKSTEDIMLETLGKSKVTKSNKTNVNNRLDTVNKNISNKPKTKVVDENLQQLVESNNHLRIMSTQNQKVIHLLSGILEKENLLPDGFMDTFGKVEAIKKPASRLDNSTKLEPSNSRLGVTRERY